jgi:hypothetical protein
MTAEVAVLNRNAIALAADSAVTIGESKVYNTVNKLFTLSKHHPVGIMIYGNADYMGIPWETIIKLYREDLGRKKFSTLGAYTRDFLRYLDRGFDIDDSDERKRVLQIWYSYFLDLNRDIRRLLLGESATRTLKQSDVDDIFEVVLDTVIAALRDMKTLTQYRKIKTSQVWSRFEKQFDFAKTHGLRGRRITPGIEKRLREFATLLLIKDEFRLATSGVVVAGFGDDDIYPSLDRIQCAGRLLGRMKIKDGGRIAISSKDEDRSCVHAFAQGEMVVRFMEGIDPAYSVYLREGVDTLVDKLCEGLIAKYSSGSQARKSARIKAAQAAARKMVADLEDRAKRRRYDKFIQPILNIVAVLPKEELAELAWALVNITSLKRKISMDAETVGGPIDVAVISKGDGFIWIRRKHYFKAELNPWFLQKYFSDQA